MPLNALMQRSPRRPLSFQCPLRIAALVRGAFADYLRTEGLSPSRIESSSRAVRYAAAWYARRQLPLPAFHRRDLGALVNKSASPAWRPGTVDAYRQGLQWWLRFHGRFEQPRVTQPWDPLVGDYVAFLREHRGFAEPTCMGHRRAVQAYLSWQFRRHEADWARVSPTDLWQYSREFQRQRQPGTLNHELGRLKLFLKYLLMGGAPVSRLIAAVPRFFNYGTTPQIEILSDAQRRQLLGSFDRRCAQGARDYAIVLCLLDLGLRPQETIRLCLSDLDWDAHRLRVPAAKGDRVRELPVPARIEHALKRYVFTWRPASQSDRVFLRDGRKAAGLPMDCSHQRWALTRAYRRCGFPKGWQGGYRLRHTFASRLHARGADLKQIADLLGHRHLQTTTLYAKVDLIGLRDLALPWPI